MYPIIITGPDAANTSFSGSFHYVTAPTIDAWGPEVIHTGGGTLVSVMLVDAISDGLVCMFSPWYQNEFTATVAIDAHFVSSSLIICESPYADPLIEIGLTAGLLGTTPEDGQAELNSIMRPAITSLQADSLFLDGGSAMNIFGTDLGMQVYDLYASLGTISPLALRWVTAAQVEAISPATVSGNKTLFLSHALSARSDPYEAELAFFKPFEPSPLIPSVVPAKDNVFVRLHAHIGSLPSSVPTCNPAAPQYTLCQEANNIGGILTQVHSVNFAILQLPGGANLTANVPQLAYVDGASSATVQPNIAVTGGGTVAVVSGVNFVEGMTSIRLGDVAQTNPYISQSFLSSALIRFEAPAGASDATASIYTSTGFVDSDSWGSAGAVMKYRGLPSMTNAAGLSLETLESGGRLVKFTGSGFVSNRDLFCKFGEVHVRATYVSATILHCVAPGLKPQTYSVRASNNMLDYSKFVNSASSDSDADVTVTPCTRLHWWYRFRHEPLRTQLGRHIDFILVQRVCTLFVGVQVFFEIWKRFHQRFEHGQVLDTVGRRGLCARATVAQFRSWGFVHCNWGSVRVPRSTRNRHGIPGDGRLRGWDSHQCARRQLDSIRFCRLTWIADDARNVGGRLILPLRRDVYRWCRSCVFHDHAM